MGNKYQIRRYVAGSKEFIKISEEEYKKIKEAKDNLFQTLFIEEKFDMVLENYFEFEETVLNSGLKNMIFRNQDYNWLLSEKRIVSRRIVNLLTACRLYVDQTRHHISTIFGKTSIQYQSVVDLFTEQYEEYLGYRVMDSIRNYVQHKGLPLHEISYSMSWVGDKSDKKMRFAVTPYICASILKEDKGFKGSVLKELEKIGEKHDIKLFLRDYISSIGIVHAKIRELLRNHVTNWDATIENAITIYKTKYNIISGLAALILTEDETMISRVNLFDDHIKHRRGLERKNTQLDSIPNRYVTSEIVKK